MCHAGAALTPIQRLRVARLVIEEESSGRSRGASALSALARGSAAARSATWHALAGLCVPEQMTARCQDG